MVIAAGWAAHEVRAHGRHRDVRPDAGQFKLDVCIELIEAFVASELRSGRAEQPAFKEMRLDQGGGYPGTPRAHRREAVPKSGVDPRLFGAPRVGARNSELAHAILVSAQRLDLTRNLA